MGKTETDTHNTIDDSVLTEQNDFPRGTNEPFPLIVAKNTFGRDLLSCLGNRIYFLGFDDSYISILNFIEFDRSSTKQCTFQIFQEIMRIFYPNAQPDEVLRKPTSSPCSRIDRCVPGDYHHAINDKVL